jgi:hypothetical protein
MPEDLFDVSQQRIHEIELSDYAGDLEVIAEDSEDEKEDQDISYVAIFLCFISLLLYAPNKPFLFCDFPFSSLLLKSRCYSLSNCTTLWGFWQ